MHVFIMVTETKYGEIWSVDTLGRKVKDHILLVSIV